ncbi:DUF1344 domain-containing protein [Breoghania sp.]|uniref:DUF1344 domain-containing protein n=1 Tax=Breoghania sp. TaxID=2065378 RepID=UPI002AAAAC02|nr:DUF1344 domain-containing protein [Breoghania sp.]
MASFIRAACALALLTLACLPASAEDAKGKIVKVDFDNYVLQLENGQTFEVPEDFYVEDLEPGMVVVIQYDIVEGKNVIADLELAE